MPTNTTAIIKAISKPVNAATGANVLAEIPLVKGIAAISPVRAIRVKVSIELIFFPFLTFSASSPSIIISKSSDLCVFKLLFFHSFQGFFQY